jgi:malic enzyme
VVAALAAEGLAVDEARRRCWLFDSRGLVVASRTDLTGHKRSYAHEHAGIADFAAAVEALKPSAIIGVAAVGGTFTREVVEAMARHNPRPIVFALSNPTSKSECNRGRSVPLVRRPSAIRLRQPVRASKAECSCRARATTPTSFRAWAWA